MTEVARIAAGVIIGGLVLGLGYNGLLMKLSRDAILGPNIRAMGALMLIVAGVLTVVVFTKAFL